MRLAVEATGRSGKGSVVIGSSRLKSPDDLLGGVYS